MYIYTLHIPLGRGDFEVQYQTSRSCTNFETVKSRLGGTKVELISPAKISTGFAEARQSWKAMQADGGEEASPPSSPTAPSGSERCAVSVPGLDTT